MPRCVRLHAASRFGTVRNFPRYMQGGILLRPALLYTPVYTPPAHGTRPESMELFAATTGCRDPAVASLYLERADNDVSRAVNFFFDAPPAPNADKSASTASMSGGDGSAISNTRSLKRPRAESSGGKHQQQLLSVRVRPSMAGSSSSKGTGKSGGTERHDAASMEPPHDRAAGLAAAPSAEWTRIAESCARCEKPWKVLENEHETAFELLCACACM